LEREDPGKTEDEPVRTPEEDDGKSPAERLFDGAREGNIELVESLLNKGMGIAGRDDDGMTVLHHAAANNHLELAKILIPRIKARNVAWLNLEDAALESPLDKAIVHEHVDMCVLLAKEGARSSKNLPLPSPSLVASASFAREPRTLAQQPAQQQQLHREATSHSSASSLSHVTASRSTGDVAAAPSDSEGSSLSDGEKSTGNPTQNLEEVEKLVQELGEFRQTPSTHVTPEMKNAAKRKSYRLSQLLSAAQLAQHGIPTETGSSNLSGERSPRRYTSALLPTQRPQTLAVSEPARVRFGTVAVRSSLSESQRPAVASSISTSAVNPLTQSAAVSSSGYATHSPKTRVAQRRQQVQSMIGDSPFSFGGGMRHSQSAADVSRRTRPLSSIQSASSSSVTDLPSQPQGRQPQRTTSAAALQEISTLAPTDGRPSLILSDLADSIITLLAVCSTGTSSSIIDEVTLIQQITSFPVETVLNISVSPSSPTSPMPSDLFIQLHSYASSICAKPTEVRRFVPPLTAAVWGLLASVQPVTVATMSSRIQELSQTCKKLLSPSLSKAEWHHAGNVAYYIAIQSGFDCIKWLLRHESSNLLIHAANSSFLLHQVAKGVVLGGERLRRNPDDPVMRATASNITKALIEHLSVLKDGVSGELRRTPPSNKRSVIHEVSKKLHTATRMLALSVTSKHLKTLLDVAKTLANELLRTHTALRTLQETQQVPASQFQNAISTILSSCNVICRTVTPSLLSTVQQLIDAESSEVKQTMLSSLLQNIRFLVVVLKMLSATIYLKEPWPLETAFHFLVLSLSNLGVSFDALLYAIIHREDPCYFWRPC